MKITPEKVSAVYTMLLSMEPFCRWSLPAAKSITFAVADLKSRRGDWDPNTKTLRVSTVCITTFLGLVGVVAHEMCHVRQQKLCRLTDANDGHQTDFKKMTAQICKEFPFDPGHF